MEILIIGIIIVGIMVIVSTKIKKRAAEAFEPETVDKESFVIEKPEGFLYPLRDESDFPFEAYSKTYGDKSTRNIWRARTRLRISDGQNLDKLRSELENGGETVTSEKTFDDIADYQSGIIIRSEKTENEVEYKVLRKIIENANKNKTYELRTTILKPHADEYEERVCEMMKSFVVK